MNLSATPSNMNISSAPFNPNAEAQDDLLFPTQQQRSPLSAEQQPGQQASLQHLSPVHMTEDQQEQEGQDDDDQNYEDAAIGHVLEEQTDEE